MNTPEIDRIFEKLRGVEHGSVIKLGLPESDGPVEATVFEPNPHRPQGYESGIFVSVPSEDDKIYYLDPEASRERGKLILKVLPMKMNGEVETPGVDHLLREFEHVRQAPDIKRGGGATGESYSKSKGITDVG